MVTVAARPPDGAPSRHPEFYHETEHFREDILTDGMRFITREMANETIREGRDYPEEGGPGKIRRKKDYDGVYAVVVLPDDDNVIVTGWTEVNSWVRAMASDRWSAGQLRTIGAFEDEEHKDPDWR